MVMKLTKQLGEETLGVGPQRRTKDPFKRLLLSFFANIVDCFSRELILRKTSIADV